VSAFSVIDHHDPSYADRIWDLQQASYAVEADLIGCAEIPPLLEGVRAVTQLDLTILGATERGDLVGIVGYRREAENVDIDRLAVHPAQFRRGYGRKLIEAVHAREESAEQFMVSTGADDLPALPAGRSSVLDRLTHRPSAAPTGRQGEQLVAPDSLVQLPS
jgi:GNAT superfamily N-acetyltransferase